MVAALADMVGSLRVRAGLRPSTGKLRWSMVLATLLLLCAAPQADDVGKVSAASASPTRQTDSVKAFDSASRDSIVTRALPSEPEPKVKSEVEPVALRSASMRATAPRPSESPRQRKMWYGLVAAGHAAAGFDAWTTRRAISGGYGQEANPFLKPFANSNAIYAAIQVSPAFMDFLGKRMMANQHPWIRRVWWVPQAAGASISFAAGAHNLGVVR